MAGFRYYGDGSLNSVGTHGFYWSSAVSGADSRGLIFDTTGAIMYGANRTSGFTVRCLKD